MTKSEKLINKFKDNPANIKLKELENILIKKGFVKIDAKGSHVKFKNTNFNIDIILPVHNNDCKDFYKKQTLNILNNYNLI